MMESKITKISRIDRAVADNSKALKESFGEHALLVQDFIIFIMKNLKYNLFGFTEFSLAEFCDVTGNSRAIMSTIHPDFDPKKSNRVAPEKSGTKFVTVFDYTLHLMMQRNLIFSKGYTTQRGEQAVHLESIGIISDIHIILGANGRKKYHVKISPDLIDGFVNRYYTVDADAYKLLGKGKSSIMRKTFFIFLCKIRHQVFSQNKTTATYPVDILAAEAGITSRESFHTKQSLTRILDKIKEIGFPFDYEYSSIKKGKAKYYVNFTFIEKGNKQTIPEHRFFVALMDDLILAFNSKYSDRNFKDPEPFQRWLTTNDYDIETKFALIKKNYQKFFNIQLNEDELRAYVNNGFVYNNQLNRAESNNESYSNVDFDYIPIQ